MGRSFDEDPLTRAMQPPPDETYEQRLIREAAEAEAKRVSDEIDEMLRKEREAERRRKKPVKLLLLGAPLVLIILRSITNMSYMGHCRPEREREDCHPEKYGPPYLL